MTNGADDVEVSDEELTALALAADPDTPLGPDAVPIALDGGSFPELLPEWYMATPKTWHRSGRRATVAAVIIISLLVINALGLCITYGQLEIAW